MRALLLRHVLTLAAAFAGAFVAGLVHLPLPWFLGPLLAVAVANLAGAALPALPGARDIGQWIIGVALGLYFTPDVVRAVVRCLPWIGAATIFMLALGACGAWALRRWGKVDATTSFFAMAVGGASEMAAQAERYGGRVDRVSAAHSLRISLVAVLVPLALRAAGVEGTDLYQPALQSFDARGFAVLVAVTGGAAIVLARTGAPNVFMIGPLLVTAALTASGHGWSALPGAVVDAGQLLLGIALGSRYAPDFFRAAPRYLAVVAALTVVYLGLGALLGWALAAAALLPLPTALLATTPGGIGEMALTAKVLKLGAPIVTAFHAVRMVLVVLLVGPLFRAQRAWSRRSTR